jgi:peptidyl-dipeptidase A
MTEVPSPESLLAAIESELLDLGCETQRAAWVYATHITPDTEELAARSEARYIRATVAAVRRVAALHGAPLDPITTRKAELLRLSLPLAAPADPRAADEVTRLVASMTGRYGTATYTPAGASGALDVQGLDQLMGQRTEPAVLEELWSGWHAIARPMRGPFERYVSLANQGARELGFEDTGAMWRSKYEMPPEAFEREVERLWEQVRPLYTSLHAYVRWRLHEALGPSVVPAEGPIPAHLLGNMWAQSWEHLADRLWPPGAAGAPNLTARLVAARVDAQSLVRYGERFFVSLGLPPLPSTFWERSMFTRPVGREVVCHASAWDIDFADDLRLKMCIEITEDDFLTVHHELGHNYYQRAYAAQPYLFRDGAHDGFHEAIGDALALSVTPEYLERVGLGAGATAPEDDLRLLLVSALGKIAFLPFGLAVDAWRWRVFAGAVPPAEYTRSWWEVRGRYQGVVPPGRRVEEEFDPGAKFHVPANVPYMRYFLAHLLQFQMHRAFARLAGARGPLHRASIYGSAAVGERLQAMLAMGQSRPWPEALEAATGERRMDASALLEYFEPLERWLNEQNRGHPVGW